MWVFYLSHYAWALILALLSFGLGRRLTRTVPYASVWEEIAFSTAIGLGIVSYLVFGLGLLHLLYRGIIFLALAVSTALTFPVFADAARRFVKYWSRSSKWVPVSTSLAILLIFIPILKMPLYPPTLWDSLLYHLPIAKLDVQTHSLAYSPYIRYPAFPQLNEMLFSLMMLLKDDLAAQLVQFLMMLLIAIGMLAWGKRLFSTTAGIWAGVIWLSNPFVLVVGSSAYIDIGVTLFVTLGAYGFSNWLQTRRTSWLVLSGILFGLGAASKYLALPPLCALAAVVLVLSIRNRNARPIAIFLLTAAMAAIPWYVRNYHYTGNPVWPYFGAIFGYGPWNAADLKGLVHIQYAEQSPPRSLTAFLLLPWNISFRLLKLFHMDSPAPMAPTYFFTLPVVALYALRNRYARLILVGVFAYTVFWFFSFQAMRFLFPAVAMLSLAAMAACADLLNRIPAVKLHQRTTTALVAVLLLFPGWEYCVSFWRQGHVPITSEQRHAFLTRKFPEYPAYRLLNEKYGTHYVINAPGDELMTYFTNGSYEGDYFGPARCFPILRALSQNGEALYKELQRAGAGFFLLDERHYRRPESVGLPLEVDDSFFRSHFRIIWAAPNIQLFEVTGAPIQQSVGPELIRNGSFEGSPCNLSSWHEAGTPVLDDGGQHSHLGTAAVGLTLAESLSQKIEVRPSQLYHLSHWTRATEPGQSTRLQINWLSAQGFLRTDIEVVSAASSWQEHQMFTGSPEGARWAVVYLQVHSGDGLVWFDDISLREITYENHPVGIAGLNSLLKPAAEP